MTRSPILLASLLLAGPGLAADALPPAMKVTKLDVRPAAVELTGPFACAQLLVTATLENGDTVDVTRLATVAPPLVVVNAGSAPVLGAGGLFTGTTRPAPALVAVSPTGMVRPVADGKGTLTVSVAGKSVPVPVGVSGFVANKPISFTTDVQPVLSKLGCNAGTCHGAAAGKSGFKLSLRGYDPIYDHRALTDDLEGRRFNRAAPERSLMLLKPSGAIPHTGGVVWQPGDPNFELVRRWIAEGVKLDLAAPRVKSIEVFPKVVTLAAAKQTQQFAVVATYADGRTRDVSAEAFIDSSNMDVATVDKAGLLTSARRGEVTLLARFEGAYAAAGVVVMGDRSGYEWRQQPVQNRIDELVDAKLKKMKIQASDLCTDEEFLRRVSLDLAGLPPTADEVRAFVADPRPSREKRDATVDRLVGSPAFVDQWTNKWSDLLQVNRKFLGDQGAKALRHWIRDAIADNVPYDRFAYQILTASGSNVTNPPAAYYKVLRDPDEVMENTTQLFLAVRFNCNKCHDHPFEKWTQDQYYETAAFFARVTRAEDPKFKGQTIGGTNVERPKPLVEVIQDVAGGEVTHARTGAVAPPQFPFPNPTGNPPDTLSRRERLAKWTTAPDNAYFAKSYVNRVWSYLTGIGIIEPVDDIRAGNPPTNPELLDYLTKDFVDHGFNTRRLMRLICQSRTYQLSFTSNKWNNDDEINYSRAVPRRLSAEALFDSIHKVTGAVSRLPGLPPGARAAQLVDGTVDLPGGFLELFGKPVRESACECERSNTMMLGPVLAMVNGPIVGDAIRDPNNHISKLVAAEKDDAKVVEEIYLSVLNRRPTAKEVEVGLAAVRGATKDHGILKGEFDKRTAAFNAYAKSIDGKLKGYEATLVPQKPTRWTTFAPATATSTGGAVLSLLDDGAVLASGKVEKLDDYKLTTRLRFDGHVTAIRLEVLTDPTLPKNGPGRSDTGNFVLNEFTVKARPSAGGAAAVVQLVKPQATFSQQKFPIKDLIDGKPDTGWAVSPQVGKPHTAIFQLAKPISAADGVVLEFELHQQFGMAHNLGKFRISYTTDRTPTLTAPVSLEVADILETPDAQRTPQQVATIRNLFVAQDGEYLRLQAEIPAAPPADPRLMGAQDLTWALINTPAFLFNR